jgi:hypothetical protein
MQGLIATLSASNIMLALEPECAMLAALADCAPPVRAKLQPGVSIGAFPAATTPQRR